MRVIRVVTAREGRGGQDRQNWNNSQEKCLWSNKAFKSVLRNLKSMKMQQWQTYYITYIQLRALIQYFNNVSLSRIINRWQNYGSLHPEELSDVLCWRGSSINTNAAVHLWRDKSELELNDDLYCNNTVILAGSYDTSLKSVTWKAGSLVGRQHQRADGQTTLSFSSDPQGAKNEKRALQNILKWLQPSAQMYPTTLYCRIFNFWDLIFRLIGSRSFIF